MIPKKEGPQTPAGGREEGATPKGYGAKSDAVREAAILALLTEESIQLAAERCGSSSGPFVAGSLRMLRSRRNTITPARRSTRLGWFGSKR